MINPPETESALLRQILDAIPSFVFVVDEDVRVLEYNAAAGELLGLGRQKILLQRSGELLHCLHAREAPGGCGHSEACQNCVVRGAVREAFGGNVTVRRRAKMDLLDEEEVRDFYAFISATPFAHDGRKMVLLVIEDINEIADLQRIVPICMKCRKVRDDDQYWTRVEEYFKRHWDLRFSHGLCPHCAKVEMDQLLHLKPSPPAS